MAHLALCTQNLQLNKHKKRKKNKKKEKKRRREKKETVMSNLNMLL